MINVDIYTNWVNLEASEITELSEPDDVFDRDTEKVVGEMSELDKRLFTLMINQERDLLRIKAEIQAVQAKKNRLSFVVDLLWAVIREENGLWATNHIGVRQGWKIVSVEIPPMIMGLGKFLGMGGD